MAMWSKYVRLFQIILALTIWTSCQKKPAPSIIVLAFDRLPASSVTCSETMKSHMNSGLALLCRESIRYTQSYSTSTQPAAAMASVLTGLYPYEHRLHRSFDRLDQSTVLISQLAKTQNYRTAFISGSPHILKKTGLSNYFDLFDDSAAINMKTPFSYFSQQSENLINWIDNDDRPFLSFIYNSQINFYLKNDIDNAFNEKLDNDLFTFFKNLKQRHIWEKSYIILIGLNGHTNANRDDFTPFTNLHSENTNVVTLVKIPRQKGDEGISWKSDGLISLKDLGYTLKCLIQNCTKENTESINLHQQWNSMTESSTINDSREIIVESPSTWIDHHFSWSVVKKDSLWIWKNTSSTEVLFFNTLNDKYETVNLKTSSTEQPKIFSFFKTINQNFYTDSQIEKINSILQNIKKDSASIESTNLILENIWGLKNL